MVEDSQVEQSSRIHYGNPARLDYDGLPLLESLWGLYRYSNYHGCWVPKATSLFLWDTHELVLRSVAQVSCFHDPVMDEWFRVKSNVPDWPPRWYDLPYRGYFPVTKKQAGASLGE